VEHVGVRAFRSNLAAFLERASLGEEFVVTEHGKPVARVGPVSEDELIMQRLAEEGRVRRARRPRRSLPPPPGAELFDSPVTRILLEQRGATEWPSTSTRRPSSS
jgi:prevent-host-death family protein